MLLGYHFAYVFISIFLSNTPKSDEKDQLSVAQDPARDSDENSSRG